ncbi:MAG: four-carbon acid sugar kinase family protein [Bryobacterales bacterium]|nr:four-carbon acid sugar kinase family protein [Bryobacteraceae bacterium]MDW8354750.1 four-carbon acid sugar kinase family protein [Bryobacterales bacterium]
MSQPAGDFGLVADDLTGACDAGVQFAQHGLRTLVWLSGEGPPAGVDVLVLVTEGRALAPEKARAAAKAASERLRRLGHDVLFQKIDSTLRGNPGHEILGVMEAGGFDLAILTPAFPAMGRIVERGWLHATGAGEPVHVAARLREQGIREVVEAGSESWLELERSRRGKPIVVLVDARSEADLDRAAQLWCAIEPRPLAVGSAGLARAVARALAGPPLEAEAPHGVNGPAGAVLLMIGSTHPVTAAQVEALVQSGAVVLDADQLPAARRALMARCPTVVQLEPAQVSTARLSAWRDVIRECSLCGLVLCGGDTALAVCRALAVEGIELEREVVTGIPSGRLVGGPLAGLPVVTKAGGFGGPDALAQAVKFLLRRGANLQ